MRKKHRMIRNLLIDAAAAALALMVFALFHHVLPMKQQSLNVQTVNPAAEKTEAAATTAAETIAEAEPETAAAEAPAKAETGEAETEEERFRPAD